MMSRPSIFSAVAIAALFAGCNGSRHAGHREGLEIVLSPAHPGSPPPRPEGTFTIRGLDTPFVKEVPAVPADGRTGQRVPVPPGAFSVTFTPVPGLGRPPQGSAEDATCTDDSPPAGAARLLTAPPVPVVVERGRYTTVQVRMADERTPKLVSRVDPGVCR